MSTPLPNPTVRHPSMLLATALRLLRQLRHDPRTIALMLVVPVVLMGLVYAMFDGNPRVDGILLIMLGMFPFIVMFLVTSIAMLRERTSGTLERLMTTPLAQADLLFGYGLAFGSAAVVQAVVASGCATLFFGLDTAGGTGLVVLVAVLTALLGVGLGLLCSAFARTEFQAVQLLPVIVVPQILLCGLFVDRADMAGWLRALSNVMPLSYSVEALQQIGASSTISGTLVRDLLVVGGCVVVALGLAAATLRRRTP